MISAIDPMDLLDCAIASAKAGGRHALTHIARRSEVVHAYAHDVKLQLDSESQDRASEVIRAAFPDHAILGEETSTGPNAVEETPATPSEAAYEWVIDPIDGTVNFSHGHPWWCTSVAVRQGNTVLAGCVYAPAMDKLYAASATTAATCNGEPIHVSAVTAIQDAIVFTGLDRFIREDLPKYTVFKNLARHTQKTRIMGAAALDLCQVACGHGEGYFESGIFIWDVAAAGLIIERAGGRGEILGYQDAPHRLLYLASNGILHDELKDTLGI